MGALFLCPCLVPALADLSIKKRTHRGYGLYVSWNQEEDQGCSKRVRGNGIQMTHIHAHSKEPLLLFWPIFFLKLLFNVFWGEGISARICVCVPVGEHVEARGGNWMSSIALSFYSLESWSKLVLWLGWMASELLESTCLPPSTVTAGMCSYAQIFM